MDQNRHKFFYILLNRLIFFHYIIRYKIKLGGLDVVSIETLDLDTEKKSVST
jgi:hypothetical protein